MTTDKRVIILSGHYGSGKTNIAVNLAVALNRLGGRTYLVDLDIVNPYYRSLDSKKQLEAAGVGVIGSCFANSNLDVPALPKEIYAVTGDTGARFVLDVGGDDRGALALGRLKDGVTAEGNFEMWAVVNRFRPLTQTAPDAAQILKEIERASGMAFTGVINNTNLGNETTQETVLQSLAYAEQTAELLNVPLVFTTVPNGLFDMLQPKIANLFPLKLQEKNYE